jgi:energy-converting hydrogenase Eha subunit A
VATRSTQAEPDRATRLVGLYAVLAAVGALIVSPLLALSYFATESGASELESGTVSAWADPARDVADGLLTWASSDRVYGAYFFLFWVFMPAVFLCASAVRARRPDEGRLERWGWRAALAGYGLSAVGAIVAIAIFVSGSAESALIDVVFLAVMIPALALDVIGSTVLGVALIRTRYEPRLTAWLLTLAFPSLLVIPSLLGNLSLGLLIVFAAWAVSGWRLWRAKPPARLEESRTAVSGNAGPMI